MNKKLLALALIALMAESTVVAAVEYANGGSSTCCPAPVPYTCCAERRNMRCCTPRPRRARCRRARICRPKRVCCPRMRCCRPRPTCCPVRPVCDGRPCIKIAPEQITPREGTTVQMISDEEMTPSNGTIPAAVGVEGESEAEDQSLDGLVEENG